MATPIPVTLNDLVTVATYNDVLGIELNIATALGFPTTAWQPIQVDRSTLAIMAQLGANFSVTVNFLAQGAYASYAAQMVDSNGVEVTTWMDLRGVDQYNVTRLPATYATCDSTGFSITNSSAQSYGPFAPRQLHFQQSSALGQPTYTNSETVTIAGSAATGVALVADKAGLASSAGPGTITTMLTALVGCTCTNTATLTGQDAETNAHYLQRCQAKLGSLSPDGPAQAYLFVAESILDSTQPFYNASLSAAITRVTTLKAPSLVYVYIANASGTEPTGDLAIVDAAIQAWVVPSGTTAIVAWATPYSVPITYTAYIPASAGVSAATLETAVSDALALYFETIPIGGLTDASSGILPVSGIIGTIWGAIAKLTPVIGGVTVSVPSADISLGPTSVATLGTITASVVMTS